MRTWLNNLNGVYDQGILEVKLNEVLVRSPHLGGNVSGTIHMPYADKAEELLNEHLLPFAKASAARGLSLAKAAP